MFRKVLVVLDNARDSDQVRPLLPGSAGSLAIVTSRRQLSSLVVGEGAHTITLDLLTAGESTALLAGRLGADRVAAEPDAVARIVARCARLPLALAIAAVAALPVRAVDALLTELTGAHLVEEHVPGRYGFHDLQRAYASELARSPAGDAERADAADRMFDHYLHTAFAADRLLDPSRDSIELPDRRPGTEPGPLGDAQVWFAREHAVLLALLGAAEQAGRDRHMVHLTWALSTFHNRRDLARNWVATHVAALSATERIGERRVLADVHRELGRAYTWAGTAAR